MKAVLFFSLILLISSCKQSEKGDSGVSANPTARYDGNLPKCVVWAHTMDRNKNIALGWIAAEGAPDKTLRYLFNADATTVKKNLSVLERKGVWCKNFNYVHPRDIQAASLAGENGEVTQRTAPQRPKIVNNTGLPDCLIYVRGDLGKYGKLRGFIASDDPGGKRIIHERFYAIGDIWDMEGVVKELQDRCYHPGGLTLESFIYLQ